MYMDARTRVDTQADDTKIDRQRGKEKDRQTE